MYVDMICTCTYAYSFNILNKINVAVNGYMFTTINHAMRWASDEDYHVI